jgi:hypothetical protein
MVPKSQLWILHEPNRSRIERGLVWAARTRPKETSLRALLNRRPSKPAKLIRDPNRELQKQKPDATGGWTNKDKLFKADMI